MTKATILAAGKGTRVRPLTKFLPKPMVPILGKPVMEYLIEHLARHAIVEVMVNVAFQHRKIEHDFGDGRRWGVEIGYSCEGMREHGWIDIGRVSDYWSVLQQVLCGEVAPMHMPGRELRPGVRVGLNTSVDLDSTSIEGPVYLGSKVRVEPGAGICGPAWVGHGSHRRSGSVIDRSVVFEHARIGAGQRFSAMIVAPEYCVDRHGKTFHDGDEHGELRWRDERGC